MNIKNLKRGSKFQLTKDIVVTSHDWGGSTTKTVFDKGLVLSLVNLSVISTGNSVWFKILKPKPIVEKFYQDINPEVYASGSRWMTWRDVIFKGEYFSDFFDAVENGDVIPFDEEYNKLTSIKVR